MKVFRLSKEIYKEDLSGIGAEKYGGRWNNKGTRMVYTSESRALANLEVAVHVALNGLPKDYFMVTIEIPENFILTLDQSKLVGMEWKLNPPSELTQEIGDNFIRENEALVLKVPSAIVKEDFNFLINPQHPEIDKVTILETELFSFDKRLFRLR